jgi:hypothetical protein
MTRKADIHAARRETRLRIGRLRRRINGRVRAVGEEGVRLVSWRTWVEHYAGRAVLAALGAGLALAAGLRSRAQGPRPSLDAVCQWLGKALGQVWEEVRRRATEAASGRDASASAQPEPDTGGDDGRG